jgi:hypothetical protein
MIVVLGPKLRAAEAQIAIPNYGQLQVAKRSALREGFSQPDMIYAPFAFWMWDEPLDANKYPAKARSMAKEMLKQGINPGYASPRITVAEMLGPKFMAPSPSLPKEQWLSSEWFKAFDGALQEAESAKGYFGYVDEYMWPSGRAAGRVMQKHPELANASLQWEVTDVPAGTKVDLPASFFTVAAQLGQPPNPSRFCVPISSNNFELVWSAQGDPPRVDLFDKASLGQTVTVEQERLAEVSIALAGWKETSDAKFTIEARLGGPEGRLIASQHFNGGVRTSAFVYFWIALPIPEALPVGSKLYVAMIPDPGLPEKELGWWSHANDAYVGGEAFLNGKPVAGDRHIRLSYLLKPESAQARLPYQPATIRSATLRLIGSGDKFSWTAPSEGGWWRVYSFKMSVGGDVNVLDTRLAAAFVDIAHKPYLEHFGRRMGKSIPGVFCDTEGGYGSGNGLAWSESLAPRYLANTGRDVRLWMPLLLDQDVEGISARARFDWFDAVSDLYAGYFAEVSRWLAHQGMYYIANLWEESLTWQASCVSDYMKVQRAFTMPGCDALGLRAYEVHDFKEAQSVSEFESRRFLSEMLDAGGWSTFNPVSIKEGANAAVAWGVNHMVCPGPFMTRVLEGNVWVPDWYDENPIWPYLHLWSDFTRRAMYVNSHGRVVPDVLLLNPMESVWALLGKTEKLWCSPEAGNVGLIQGLYDPKVQNIDAVYSEAMTQLASHRVEYLIADRHYMNQMSVKGAELVRGEFRFKTVVLPPMVVLPLSVARKIVNFAKAGGAIYTLGELPTGSTDNGLKDPAMAALMAELRALPNVKSCPQGLAQELDARSTGLSSPIQFTAGEFPMLQLRRRIDDRDFFWLVNNNEQARQCVVQVADVKGGASVWDCEAGNIRAVASTKERGGVRLQLALQPHEAYWLVFDPKQPVRSRPVMALPNEKVVLAINGKWNARVDTAAQPNLEHPVQIPGSLTGSAGVPHDLTLWDTWKELPGNFSGLLDYTKAVTLPKFEGQLVLDLGKVNHFAEVWVNGKLLGAKLWPPHKFQTDAFRPGRNEIRIRVGNLVNNNYGMTSPSGLVGPVIVKTSMKSNEERIW